MDVLGHCSASLKVAAFSRDFIGHPLFRVVERNAGLLSQLQWTHCAMCFERILFFFCPNNIWLHSCLSYFIVLKKSAITLLWRVKAKHNPQKVAQTRERLVRALETAAFSGSHKTEACFFSSRKHSNLVSLQKLHRDVSLILEAKRDCQPHPGECFFFTEPLVDFVEFIARRKNRFFLFPFFDSKLQHGMHSEQSVWCTERKTNASQKPNKSKLIQFSPISRYCSMKWRLKSGFRCSTSIFIWMKYILLRRVWRPLVAIVRSVLSVLLIISYFV